MEPIPYTLKPFGQCYDKNKKYVGDYIFLHDNSSGREQIWLDKFCDYWYQTSISNPSFHLTIDLETQGLSEYFAKIILVCISWCDNRSLVFVPDNFDLTAFKKVLKQVPIVNQNIGFDYRFLKHYYDTEIKIKFDTMTGTKMGYSGVLEKFDLANIVSKISDGFKIEKAIREDFPNMVPKVVNGITYWVGKTDHYPSLTDEHVEYGGRDAMTTNHIGRIGANKLIAEDLMDLWSYPEKTLCKHFADFTHEGIRVDFEVFDQVAKDNKAKMEEYEQKLCSIIRASFTEEQVKSILPKTAKKNSPVFKPSSHEQIKKVCTLFGYLMPNTEKSTLEEFKVKYNIHTPYWEFLDTLIEWKKLHKFNSTFITPFITEFYNPITDRVHPNVNQLTPDAKTGRLACQGPNLMAMPEKSRAIVIADEGGYLTGSDLSQYELRKAAAESGEDLLLTSFHDRALLLPEVKTLAVAHNLIDPDTFVKDVIEGKIDVSPAEKELIIKFAETDVHRQTAQLIFNIPAEKVTKALRAISKTLNYVLLYLGGPDVVQEGLAKNGYKYSFTECEKWIQTYNDSFKKLSAYRNRLAAAVEEEGVLATTAGRKRWFTLPPKYKYTEYQAALAQLKRQAVNYPQQGANADAIKYAQADMFLLFWYHRNPEDFEERATAIEKDVLNFLLGLVGEEPIYGRTLFPVHDEYLSCAKENPEHVLKVKQEVLIYEGGRSVDFKVPIECSGFISTAWGK